MSRSPGPPAPAAWHLIAGSTGAGKTTHARALAEQIGGVVFSIDEWMSALFWPDCPAKNDLPWAMERVHRCEAQAAAVGRQLLARNVPAIFDMGLTSRALREPWHTAARNAGALLFLHVLDLPATLRWQRVEARNVAGAGTFAFPVTRAVFDLVETMWEPPGSPECALYTDVFWLTSDTLLPLP